MYLLFALVALPPVLCVLGWAALTVYRLYRAERPLAYRAAPVVVRRRAAVAEVLPVGVREIRENQRRVLEEQPSIRYTYAGGYSQGVPAAWIEDLWRRRN